MNQKQTKQDVNNRCTNELNIQLISQIKNGVFYCEQFNKMVSFSDDCKSCKYYIKN